MTLKEFKESTRGVAPNSDIVFFPEGVAEDDKGKPMLPGIGYFDMETHELVYIGDITILEDED